MRVAGRRSSAIIGMLGLALAAASCGTLLEKAVRSPIIESGAVTFRLRAPSARTVQLAGDWPENNWAAGDADAGEILVGLMEKGKEDVWAITLRLEPGRYRYRFLIDETRWTLDPENPRIVDDGKGGKANLVIVP